MRFLKPVNVLAAANMLCFAYAISGLLAFILFIFKGGDRVVLPMGLWLPEFHLTIDFKVFRANNLIFPIWGIPLCILCGLVTGWITGATCASLTTSLQDSWGDGIPNNRLDPPPHLPLPKNSSS
jgi:hypothetical protein